MIEPYKVSEPRVVMTIFGAVTIDGPFADDYTRLNWQYDDHWSGESARFRVAGLEAYVKDCDGDDSFWILKDVRTRMVIAEGSDHGFKPPHFFACLALAERALRDEVSLRKASLARRS
jgi:hypothetical protein